MEKIKKNFTRIENELLESLCAQRILSGQEISAVLFILRKTNGYRKIDDNISFSQFATALKIPRYKIPRLLRSLEKKGVIGVTRQGNRQVNTYWIIRDYKNWKVFPRKGTGRKKPKTAEDAPQKGLEVFPNSAKGVPQMGYEVFSDKGTTKEIKENYKRNKETPSAGFLISSLTKKMPEAYGPHGDSLSPEEEAKRRDFLEGQKQQLKARGDIP